MFFTALSFLPTLLLFLFTSDLVNRNIEQWFKTDVNQVLDDTRASPTASRRRSRAAPFTTPSSWRREMRAQGLLAADKRAALEAFVRTKLAEYKLAEIAVYREEEPLFVYLDPNLPLQDYNELKLDKSQTGPASACRSATSSPWARASSSARAWPSPCPTSTPFLITTGMFLPQN